MKPSEHLKRTRNLLANPENWTQGAFARTADGSPIWPEDARAVCFCPFGALWNVSGQDNDYENYETMERRPWLNPEQCDDCPYVLSVHGQSSCPLCPNREIDRIVERVTADFAADVKRIMSASPTRPQEAAMADEIEALRALLKRFEVMANEIASDLGSAHSARGSAASGWMREDDRDQLEAFDKLIADVRAALAHQTPGDSN